MDCRVKPGNDGYGLYFQRAEQGVSHRHCERTRSNPSRNRKKEWIASSQALLAMTMRHTTAFSPRHAPEVLHRFPALSKQRAQGMPGVRCAQ
jgi:hypothetical protein